MEEILSLSLYKTDWSLLDLDGPIPGSGPGGPATEAWFQQDELRKAGTQQSLENASDLVDQLFGIQQQIGEDVRLDDSWLSNTYSLSGLLSPEEPVTNSESTVTLRAEADPRQNTHCVQGQLADQARGIKAGTVSLGNGQHCSQTWLEELLNSDGPRADQQQPSESDPMGDVDFALINSHIDFNTSQDSMASLSAEDIESFLSSCPLSPEDERCPLSPEDERCPSSPEDESCATDSSSSPGHDVSYPEEVKDTDGQSVTPHKSRSTRPKEERKTRKKEQNRSAATRYRKKKRQEKYDVNDEYLKLQEHNKKLKEQVTNISEEIEYLKNLMSEVYKAKKAKGLPV